MSQSRTCAGASQISGRRENNLILEFLDGKVQLHLPTLIECDLVPDDRAEIPSPDVARHHPTYGRRAAVAHHKNTTQEAELVRKADSLGHAVFKSSKDDNKTALSIDDRAFLTIMEIEVYQDTDHSWVAPLPFRSPRQSLPSNRELAVKRLGSLKKSLEKKQETNKHYTEFMQKMLDNDQAEHAPPLEPGKEHWYLPTFGVYHPMNPGKIRVVFDSSAECDGICLNYVLNSGTDLNNTLLECS
ncbi:hypothetical protein NFI96_017446 [Prochilodus magdalenae]|nr:hypothetical protein NFI96_017446 [Prochilodus magdalenae]